MKVIKPLKMITVKKKLPDSPSPPSGANCQIDGSVSDVPCVGGSHFRNFHESSHWVV